jgi:hypothetical protein
MLDDPEEEADEGEDAAQQYGAGCYRAGILAQPVAGHQDHKEGYQWQKHGGQQDFRNEFCHDD